MQAAADAKGRIAGGGGSGGPRADRTAAKRAVAEMPASIQRAVDALEAASAEFGQAAKLSEATADWWARAAESFGRAGQAGLEGPASVRGEEARKMARTLDEWAGRSGQTAGKFRAAATGWVADTAGWREDGRAMDGVDRDRWLASGDTMREAADGARALADDMVQKTDRAARVAADELAHTAAESDRRAAAAGDDLARPDAQDALAAWKEGMEAAERAAGGR